MLLLLFVVVHVVVVVVGFVCVTYDCQGMVRLNIKKAFWKLWGFERILYVVPTAKAFFLQVCKIMSATLGVQKN